MYLKRLDMQGFKSFPDKIRFEFNKGITAVVGPNGSGKSNVADAIRWVLGEQSAKSLRGSRMEDIIFSGTTNRKPLGFADVSITIDNSDFKLKIDFNEVTITRRVFRSGESEFHINGSPCRLKDIHELLMDTGIGREGYSIIGQGRIDEILSTRSEDRRLIFEEAAGIVKFKNRRSEAEIKLEKERQNLIRVNDIISELEAQLAPLHAQAEKAKHFLTLKENLKLLHVNIFLHEVERSEDESNSLDESLSVLNSNLKADELDRQDCLAEVAALKSILAEIESQTKEENDKYINSRLEFEQKENGISIINEQISHLHTNADRRQAEIAQKEFFIEKKHESMRIEEAGLSGLEIKRSVAADKLMAKQSEFDALNSRMSEGESKIEKHNTDIIELIKKTSEIKGKIQKLRSGCELLESRKEQLIEENLYNNSQTLEKEVKLQVLSNRLSKIDESINRIKNEQARLTHDRSAKQSLITEQTANKSKNERLTSEIESKIKILSGLENEHEGYNKSVKAIFNAKTARPSEFNGVRGTVGELIFVPKAYETAIEIALGGAVQNIIVTDENVAKHAIKYLKSSSSGRATFLPMTAVKPRSGAHLLKELATEKGILGMASELITYDEAYSGIIKNLLGRVFVADNLDNATTFFKRHNYEHRVVTLDGELLSPGGAIAGGSLNKKEFNIFGRSRQIRELKTELNNLQSEYKVISNILTKLNEDFSIINECVESNRELLQKYAVERVGDAQELKQVEGIISELKEKSNDISKEDAQLIHQLTHINTEVNQESNNLLDVEQRITETQKELDSFQSMLVYDREDRNLKVAELMQLKSDVSALEQNIKAAMDNKQRIDEDIRALQNEIIAYKNEIFSVNTQIMEKEKTIINIQDECAKILNNQMAAREKVNELAARKEEATKNLSRLEVAERKLADEISVQKSDIIRIEMKRDQIIAEARKLYDMMWDEYKITYQTAANYARLDLSISQLNRDERRIKSEISELGEVNVGSIEDYKAVKSRHDFLNAQRTDILEAEIKLNGVIKELVLLMERQFMDQFNQISENFSIVFREMFGGGNAYLKLSDESNVLKSGIEIVSNPPGKNISNMTLLSGGEHALTAIALLFGILRLKPSPFCLLDEIEASLDDANVLRYAQYLKKFSHETQFILITHRKGSMEAADILYGITMQEQGISKPVSVRFTQDVV